jgi:hypothetical protein
LIGGSVPETKLKQSLSLRLPLSDGEYNRLFAIPFDKMTDEEFRALAAEVRRRGRRTRFTYDPREFQGAHYWERGFLSCVIAGAAIPDGITGDYFRVPRNRVIFSGLAALQEKGITDLRKTGIYAKYDLLTALLKATGHHEAAGGENYLREIESMIGIPSAIRGFTTGLLRLNLGAPI